MKFKVDQKALEVELSLALGAASQKESDQKSLMQVHLVAELGHLIVRTTNLYLAYQASIPAEVEEPGSAMLDAKKLSDHISSLRGESVTFEHKGSRMSVRCGKNRSNIMLFEGLGHPAGPELTAYPLAVMPIDTLASMLNRVSFAISTDDSRYTMTSALLKVNNAGITAAATDAKKLSLAESAIDTAVGTEHKAMISKKAIAELARIQSKSSGHDVEILSDSNSNLYFHVGNRSLFALAIDGRFPEYAGCFSKQNLRQVTVKAVDMKDSLERVSNFSDDQSTAVAFTFDDSAISFSASSQSSGESEESIDISYEGDKVVVGLSSKFVLEFLRLAGDKVVNLSFFNGNSPVEFRVQGDDTWVVVIMPMNLLK